MNNPISAGPSPSPLDTPVTQQAPRRRDGDWWRGAVGYEIYLRSFLDTNGDGIGDLAGITAQLDYLADLGIDVIWITPFYPSPGKDHGYDVADYRAIAPTFGTLDDFDALVAAARTRGIRVIVDLVPNHTSDQHPWFRSAVADVHGPHRRYYLFRPPAVGGGPPNNWVSHFGGPAWTLDPAGTGDYYCHMFLPEQPDLDWANPAVMDEFLAILRFWCERGVDGFRIDVAHGLTKDAQLRDNPQLREVTADMHPIEVFESFDHVFDLHREETAEVYRRWHDEVAPFGAILLGELDTRDLDRFATFVGSGEGLDGGFVLKISSVAWEPETIVTDLLAFAAATRGGAVWATSNHDQARVVSRFGGGPRGIDRALAVTTLMVAMDGMTFLYQGEELGLSDAVVVGDNEDPLTTRNNGAEGRDVARGPVPWTPGHRNGFTSATTAWLDTAPIADDLTAAAQRSDPTSTRSRYAGAVGLRRRLPQLWDEPMTVLARAARVLVLGRGDLVVVANLDAAPYTFDPGGRCTLEFASRADALVSTAAGAGSPDTQLTIAPESTVVLRRDADFDADADGTSVRWT